MPIRNRFAELLPEITTWRRDFHSHPELMFDVHRTAGKVATLLRDFGCDQVEEGVGRTGVVAVIKGRATTKGQVIGLRADMDALPMPERTNLDYASKIEGKMHACGHDGHTAMLLGAAKYLADTRKFDGTAVLIFQPAEEEGAGGREMCEDGLMNRFAIQEVYGMHNIPGMPVGQFAIRPGPMLAAHDKFDIVVSGSGGHAAKPHECVDVALVSAQIIVSLQSIISRNMDPLTWAVVSVTALQSDTMAYNVMPDNVVLRGTVRTLDAHVRDKIEDRIRSLALHTANAFGATAKVDYQRGYPITMNAEANTQYAVDAARKVSDDVNTDPDPLLGAEDFSYMLQERPGAYILTGNGDTAALHNSAYDFNDSAIPYGASWFVEVVEARMPL